MSVNTNEITMSGMHEVLEPYGFFPTYCQPEEVSYTRGPVLGMLVEIWRELFIFTKGSHPSYIIRHSWQRKTALTLESGSMENIKMSQTNHLWELGIRSGDNFDYIRVNDMGHAFDTLIIYIQNYP